VPVSICDIVKTISVKVAGRAIYRLTKKFSAKPEKEDVFPLSLEGHVVDKGWFQ